MPAGGVSVLTLEVQAKKGYYDRQTLTNVQRQVRVILPGGTMNKKSMVVRRKHKKATERAKAKRRALLAKKKD
jgi:hypothetical protein